MTEVCQILDMHISFLSWLEQIRSVKEVVYSVASWLQPIRGHLHTNEVNSDRKNKLGQ